MSVTVKQGRESPDTVLASELARISVLVVEDEKAVARNIRRLLGRAGVQHVCLAHDVPTAVAELRGDTPFDVVLLDFVLRGGEAALVDSTMRDLALPTGLVLMTGIDAAVANEKALHMRVDEVLPKPFASETLLDRVLKAARRAEGRRGFARELSRPLAEAGDAAYDLVLAELERRLTGEQYAAVRLMLEGFTRDGAAKSEGITAGGFTNRLQRAFKTLKVDDEFEFARWIIKELPELLSSDPARTVEFPLRNNDELVARRS